jgi:hypothetical protein
MGWPVAVERWTVRIKLGIFAHVALVDGLGGLEGGSAASQCGVWISAAGDHCH